MLNSDVTPTGGHQKDTPILMFDSTFKMCQDIIIGDQLMGPDSQPRNVLQLVRGKGVMYTITPKYGEPFVVNGDYILSLKSVNEGNSIWRRSPSAIIGGLIKNASVLEYMSWAKYKKSLYKLYKTDAIEYPTAQLPINPYMMGVLLGDGGMSQRCINVTTADQEIVKEINLFAEQTGTDIRIQHQPDNKSSMYYFAKRIGGKDGRKNRVLEIVRSLGLQGHTSHTKFIPKMFLTSSIEQRLELLAGFLDTDGHTEKGSSCFSIVTVSTQMADDLVVLTRSLGLRSTKRCYNRKTGIAYDVMISNSTYDIPVRLKYKTVPYRKQIKDPLKSGFSITQLKKGNYFGFNIDGDNLYVMGDFTVTHDCTT